LDLPAQWKIHPMFHTSLLTYYQKNEIHGPNFTQSSADLLKEKEEYKVEAIVTH
jgi:hypothetical protein